MNPKLKMENFGGISEGSMNRRSTSNGFKLKKKDHLVDNFQVSILVLVKEAQKLLPYIHKLMTNLVVICTQM